MGYFAECEWKNLAQQKSRKRSVIISFQFIKAIMSILDSYVASFTQIHDQCLRRLVIGSANTQVPALDAIYGDVVISCPVLFTHGNKEDVCSADRCHEIAMDPAVSSTTIGDDVIKDDDLIGSQVTGRVSTEGSEERYFAVPII